MNCFICFKDLSKEVFRPFQTPAWGNIKKQGHIGICLSCCNKRKDLIEIRESKQKGEKKHEYRK